MMVCVFVSVTPASKHLTKINMVGELHMFSMWINLIDYKIPICFLQRSKINRSKSENLVIMITLKI